MMFDDEVVRWNRRKDGCRDVCTQVASLMN